MSKYFPAGGGTYNLNASIGSTDSSLTLSSFTEPVSGVLYTMALLNTDIAYATIAPKTSSSEFISFTGITQNADTTATLTGVTRGLAKKYPFTSSSTFKLPHSGQSVFILSDAPQVFVKYSVIENAETITGLKTFPGGGDVAAPVSGTVYATPTNDLEYASKKYVDTVAVSGAPNANTTTKGIIQIATSAQAAAGTASGSTAALLVPPNSLFNATSSAAILIPVTNASGKISSGFGGAASSLATLDGSSLVVQNPANATATPTSAKIPISSGSTVLDVGWIDTGTTANKIVKLDGSAKLPAVDGSQLTSVVSYKTLVTTYNFNTTSGNQVIAHGLGKIPRLVYMRAVLEAGSASFCDSIGYYDGINNCSNRVTNNAGTTVTAESNSLISQVTFDAIAKQEATCTVDATNITLAWTKGGSPGSATINILLTVQG